MTKEKRDRVRAEKTRLQKQRVEWKRTHPVEAAEKAAANAADSARRANKRADREAFRLIVRNMKATARAERKALAVKEAEARQTHIADMIRDTRRTLAATPIPKAKRHILPAFMRRVFATAQRGA